MAFIGPNNALAWAHFRLRGGWKRSISFSLGIIALLAMLSIGAHRLNPDGGRTTWAWAMGLLALQAACLLLFIPARIGTAVKQDVQSRMIESHRLMPMPPAHAVAGYIVGPAMQPMVFAAFNFILGGLTAAAASVDFSRWALANAILLAFAVFVWVASVFGALGTRAAGLSVFLIVFSPYFSQGYVLSMLPGMTAIVSPVMGGTIFDLRNSGFRLPAPYAIAIAAQIYFGTICFIGAARKYRSADAIGLSTLLGICLILGWVAVSCVGLRNWEDFAPRGWAHGSAKPPVQIVSSLIVTLLVAIVPIAANAWEQTRWRRHLATRDPYPLRRPVPFAVVLMICALAPLGIGFAPMVGPIPPPALLIRTAIIFALALGAIYFLYRWVYRAVPSGATIGITWIAIVWIVPVIVDLVRYGLAEEGTMEQLGRIAACSPVGALIILWTDVKTSVTMGIAAQALVVAVPLALWLSSTRRVDAAAKLAII